MSAPERSALLLSERTCRVATVDASGAPHISALWFVWDGEALWLNSLYKSQRWTNIVRDKRVSVLIDAGEEFSELRGIQISGSAVPIGEVPRAAASHADLVEPERLFAEKYTGGHVVYDGRHAWIRVIPEKISSWDFRKTITTIPS
jgi:hypothetical protein